MTDGAKYNAVIDTLLSQLEKQPRTSDGGFWHKKRYTYQMWLDGSYMAYTFLAQCGNVLGKPALFDEVVHQVDLLNKHTHDNVSGLNYHGWDESHQQAWANKETGCSPNFWGRAQGWYMMMLVDVLDYLPEEHPARNEVISILKNSVDAVLKVRDKESGVWFQVLDQGYKKGNYLESTCSSMFAYTMLKAVRKGYLDSSYKDISADSFNRLVTKFIRVDADNTISITNCCAVAGLGGNPYRDGSFNYYISEPVRDNDPKAVGPFIMACIEFEKLLNLENTK